MTTDGRPVIRVAEPRPRKSLSAESFIVCCASYQPLSEIRRRQERQRPEIAILLWWGHHSGVLAEVLKNLIQDCEHSQLHGSIVISTIKTTVSAWRMS